MVHIAVGGDDRRLVGLAARAAEQFLVPGMMSLRQRLIIGIELEHGFADELLARDAEELFPCRVDPEVVPLGVLEEDRLRDGLDQLLDEAQLLPQHFRRARGGRVLGERKRACT